MSDDASILGSARLIPPVADATRVRLFEERYGAHAFEELRQLFARPCVTYADIAARFGVTRERVRQWHISLAPDSPRGHQRRRLCQAYQQRRRLLEDPLYRAFVRSARLQLSGTSLDPVPSKTGFRKRLVRLGPWVVSLKRVTATRRRDGSDPSLFALTASRSRVDFYFFQLDDESFIFIPAAMVPRGGTNFIDVPSSKFQPFKNRLQVPADGDPVAAGLEARRLESLVEL